MHFVVYVFDIVVSAIFVFLIYSFLVFISVWVIFFSFCQRKQIVININDTTKLTKN